MPAVRTLAPFAVILLPAGRLAADDAKDCVGTWVVEKATGFERSVSVFGGVEYQATKGFALDLSAQRYNLAGGVPDRQVLLSTTWNLGHTH